MNMILIVLLLLLVFGEILHQLLQLIYLHQVLQQAQPSISTELQ